MEEEGEGAQAGTRLRVPGPAAGVSARQLQLSAHRPGLLGSLINTSPVLSSPGAWRALLLTYPASGPALGMT